MGAKIWPARRRQPFSLSLSHSREGRIRRDQCAFNGVYQPPLPSADDTAFGGFVLFGTRASVRVQSDGQFLDSKTSWRGSGLFGGIRAIWRRNTLPHSRGAWLPRRLRRERERESSRRARVLSRIKSIRSGLDSFRRVARASAKDAFLCVCVVSLCFASRAL